MENITHNTAKGSKEFGLTNTNKLIRQYEYATGLKTGSTSLAKYCVSATAEKDGVELIAVIMAAPDYKARFSDATALLNYGFSIVQVYEDLNEEDFGQVPVINGVRETVGVRAAGPFRYLDMEGADLSGIEREVQLDSEVQAPVGENQNAGKLLYKLGGNEIGSVELVYDENVEKAGFWDCVIRSVKMLAV